jgi:aminopeptidase N
MTACGCADRRDGHFDSGHGHREFSDGSGSRHYAPETALEPCHIDIDMSFDLPAKSVTGVVTTTLIGRTQGARSVTFDAIDLQDVVVSDPDGADLHWTYDGRHLRITWADALEIGRRRRIAVTYRVVDPLDGMRFSAPDDANPDRPLFVVTDHETERARYWLPCVDHPTVRVPLDFHLRAAADLTILANGALVVEEDHGDGTKTAHWRLEDPAPSYLTCLAIGDLVRVSGGEWAGIPIAFFAPTGTPPADLQRSFGATQAMLGWLSEKLGTPYPYPKYFQFAVPGIGGAMENISLVSWDLAWVMDETAFVERGWLVELVNLHEMAHSWFGDLITCRDFAHVWLKESWATYLESCWLEDHSPVDEFHNQLLEEQAAYRREADSKYTRPIVTRQFDSSWDMFDQHLYPGGAVRLHMLRRRMGDAQFWAGVREYVATFARRTVETSDFRRTLEKHGGRSLARFFDQWFHSPGYPQLKASMRHSREDGLLTLTIEQTQVDKKAGIGLFDLELNLAVQTEDGDWLHRRVELSEARHEVVFALEARPKQVVFDPDLDLLFSLDFDSGLDVLTAELRTAPTFRGRASAAERLGKGGKRRQIQALIDAYPNEPFWGVRVAIARALATSGSAEAVAALAHVVETERHPRATYLVMAQAAKFRDPAVAAALADRVDQGLPYLAHGAALKGLGAQRGEDWMDVIIAGAGAAVDWRVRREAMSALAATRSRSAIPPIRERLADRAEETLVRVAALGALAEAARWHDEAVRAMAVETIVDAGRDPSMRVRMAVPGALKRLRAVEAVGALESLIPRIAAQDGASVRRSISAIRRVGRKGRSVETLTKRVEELTTQNRKIRERLDRLEARVLGDDDDK